MIPGGATSENPIWKSTVKKRQVDTSANFVLLEESRVQVGWGPEGKAKGEREEGSVLSCKGSERAGTRGGRRSGRQKSRERFL